MAWEALPSAAIGAVIALSGTLLADRRRDGRQRERDRDLDRRKYCIEFVVVMAKVHSALRTVGTTDPSPEQRRRPVVEAMEPLYVAREQMLVSGTAEQVVAAEDAFHRLVAIRDAIRSGASTRSPEYHTAYHEFADALWRFRMTIRADLHEPELSPGDLNRPDWTERATCSICAATSP